MDCVFPVSVSRFFSKGFYCFCLNSHYFWWCRQWRLYG